MVKHDRKVYIRRRLFVLAGLFGVIVAVVLVIWHPGASGGAKDAAKVEVPSDLLNTPEPDDDKDAETPACASGDLEVLAITDQASYGPEETPLLSLSVQNTSEADCIANLGTSVMVLTVSSGSDTVWRSTDCQEAPEDLPVILAAGQTLTTDVVEWDRTRSSTESCNIDRDPVVAGGASYHLSVALADVESAESAQFLLY